MADASCFATLTPGQRQILMLRLLCIIANGGDEMAACDVQALMDDASCFAALTPGQRDILMLQLLCNISEGGGVSDGDITRGEGDPNGVVTGGTGVGEYLGYIDTLSDQWWSFGGVDGTNTGWF
jgi:hypothetical protein